MMKTRGAAMVEYAVLLVAVMMAGGVGFKVLGVKATVSAARVSSVVSTPQHEPPCSLRIEAKR